MPITTSVDFNTPSNFLASNAQVASGFGKLSLATKPSQLFSQAFDADTGFTYDNTKSEFTGGLVRQKDQRPANAILGATYTSSKDLNWITSGSTTATDIGSPILSGGKVQCRGGGNVAVMYDNAAIGAASTVGALKFRFTPNYSGAPFANTNIAEIHQPSTNNDKIVLFHGSTGPFRFTAYNNVGTAIHTAANLGASWSPVAGTEYELELNWNSATGEIRLFVDGVLRGSTPATTFTRDGNANSLHLGAGNSYFVSNGDFNDVLLFSTVQHTTGYTPGYTVPETIYYADAVTLPSFSYTDIGNLQAYSSFATTEVGAPKYIVNSKYWNGTAWVASNGSYAQANTKADVLANIASLTASDTTTVKAVFDASNTLSSVSELSVTYTGQKYNASGTIETVAGLSIQSFVSFAATVTTPASTALKFAIRVDGNLKYHNGAAWVTSDGTSVQTNTAAQVVSNIATLSLGSNSTIKIYMLLTTSDDNATPDISAITLVYDFGGLGNDPDTCIVWGYYLDLSGNAVSGATVSVQLVRDKKEYKEAASNIIEKKVSTTTDVNGYFELDLIRSSEFEGSGTYKLTITLDADELNTSKTSTETDLTFTVPDAVDKNITDILTAV